MLRAHPPRSGARRTIATATVVGAAAVVVIAAGEMVRQKAAAAAGMRARGLATSRPARGPRGSEGTIRALMLCLRCVVVVHLHIHRLI